MGLHRLRCPVWGLFQRGCCPALAYPSRRELIKWKEMCLLPRAPGSLANAIVCAPYAMSWIRGSFVRSPNQSLPLPSLPSCSLAQSHPPVSASGCEGIRLGRSLASWQLYQGCGYREGCVGKGSPCEKSWMKARRGTLEPLPRGA